MATKNKIISLFRSALPITAAERIGVQTKWAPIFIGLLSVLVIWIISWLSFSVYDWGFLPVIVCGLAAFAGALQLYQQLQVRPLPLECEQCHGLILSDTPWVCGFENCRNPNGTKVPLHGKCLKCGNAPKAFKCDHGTCDGFVYLTAERISTNYASRLLVVPAPPRVAPEIRFANKIERTEQEKQHEVRLAELDAEKRVFEKVASTASTESESDKLKVSAKKTVKTKTSIADTVRSLKAENAIIFRNDRRGLVEANLALDEWAKEELVRQTRGESS